MKSQIECSPKRDQRGRSFSHTKKVGMKLETQVGQVRSGELPMRLIHFSALKCSS